MTDLFLLERSMSHPRWEAELDDGTVVVQDDGRPGADPPCGWLRLRERVRAGGPRVVALRVAFRGHAFDAVPRGAAGYFFRQAAIGHLNGGACEWFYLTGWLRPDGLVEVRRWAVPELVPAGPAEARDPADDAAVGQSLIVN